MPGIAVAAPDGLVVAVIKNAQEKSIPIMAAEIAESAELARQHRLTPERSQGATFTVSNFGPFGGWFGTPLVVPPQVATAGFGPIKDQVIALADSAAVRRVLPLSVSADHRLIDGAELSSFVTCLEQILMRPSF